MADYKDEVQKLIDLETKGPSGLKNNKVATFAYTQKAYSDDDAQGVTEYSYTKEQNIPAANAENLWTNRTVLAKGYRSQGSSIGRQVANHFFGRCSYNLNKIHDWFASFLDTFLNKFVVNGIWDLTLDKVTGETDFSQMLTTGARKGTSFEGMSNMPEWIEQEIEKYGYWDCIVEKGAGFIKQFLFYVKQSDGQSEGHYLAIRGGLLQGEEVTNWTQWSSASVESLHTLEADTATNAINAVNAEDSSSLGTLKADTWESQVAEIQPDVSKRALKADIADGLSDNAYMEGSKVITEDWANNNTFVFTNPIFNNFIVVKNTDDWERLLNTRSDGATVLIYPGYYTATESIVLDNSFSNIIGIGDVNINITLEQTSPTNFGIGYTTPLIIDPSSGYSNHFPGLKNLKVSVMMPSKTTEENHVSAFYNCSNLENCYGNATVTDGGNYACGFMNCDNLKDCSGFGVGYSGAGLLGAHGIGFYKCTKVVSCKGTGRGYDGSNPDPVGYGFEECKAVFHCKASSNCTTKVFQNSYASLNLADSCQVSSTGGANDTANPAI